MVNDFHCTRCDDSDHYEPVGLGIRCVSFDDAIAEARAFAKSFGCDVMIARNTDASRSYELQLRNACAWRLAAESIPGVHFDVGNGPHNYLKDGYSVVLTHARLDQAFALASRLQRHGEHDLMVGLVGNSAWEVYAAMKTNAT